MQPDKSSLTNQIKQKALDLGFDAVGIAKAGRLEGFSEALEQWLNSGYQASMGFMERNKEKRADPTLLVPGAKSIISLLTSYYPEKIQPEDVPQVAKYAYGTDYHLVLRENMQHLFDYIKSLAPELEGRIFVDSAPVADKWWATQAGLGWIGKNACLINKEMGSFVFVSELIINIELAYDEPYRSNFCGSCTRCIDHCPTQAIVKPGVIDSNRCISFLTIENKEESIPEPFRNQLGNRMFGCDTCQDVCPWNKNPLTTKVEAFSVPQPQLFLTKDQWLSLDKESFNSLCKTSPVKRAKYSGVRRNLQWVTLDESKIT